MKSNVETIIKKCIERRHFFCKFITGNEVGTTGSHQAGFYIPKESSGFFMKEKGRKGSNIDHYIKINWSDYKETESRFIYYGAGTRNEYRLTRFGKGFPFLNDENVGDLFILIPEEKYRYYTAFVLNTEYDIDCFLDDFNLSPTDTNRVIDLFPGEGSHQLSDIIHPFLRNLADFPSTLEMARIAQEIAKKHHPQRGICSLQDTPDNQLLCWIFVEYELFKSLENKLYKKYTLDPFASVSLLIETANSILNRRKSRAGRSLEYHLRNLFSEYDLNFTWQAVTEGRKKPDFIFPEITCYFDDTYLNNLVFLGVKSTCKDRWRQILNEANRIPTKHLFTLQQGISENQLHEMEEERVQLVVPKEYIHTYPRLYRQKIMDLNTFVKFTKDKMI